MGIRWNAATTPRTLVRFLKSIRRQAGTYADAEKPSAGPVFRYWKKYFFHRQAPHRPWLVVGRIDQMCGSAVDIFPNMSGPG